MLYFTDFIDLTSMLLFLWFLLFITWQKYISGSWKQGLELADHLEFCFLSLIFWVFNFSRGFWDKESWGSNSTLKVYYLVISITFRWHWVHNWSSVPYRATMTIPDMRQSGHIVSSRDYLCLQQGYCLPSLFLSFEPPNTGGQGRFGHNY